MEMALLKRCAALKMKKNYDLIFGIGADGSCTEVLRKAGLQLLSFPFDWLCGGSFLYRVKLLIASNTGWLEPSDMVKQLSPEWHTKDIYRNQATGMVFNHDFPKGVPFDQSFPKVSERYARRFKRLFKLMESASTALAVYISTSDSPDSADAEIAKGLKILQKRFVNTDIDLMYFRLEPAIPPSARTIREMGEHITIVSFDFRDLGSGRHGDLVKPAGLLPFFDGISVRDYRTAGERREYRRAKRLARYSKYGATTWVQFTLNRLASHLHDAMYEFNVSLRFVCKRLWRHSRKKHHEMFVSLGYNCELAFRYFKWNGFVDSGLFQWGSSASIDQLVYAIEHLDELFSGVIRDPDPLYQCANTLIKQHGKSPMEMWGCNAAAAAISLEADREDLRGRMAYLKKKFVKTLQNGQALIAYKVRTSEYLEATGEEKINHLLACLRNLGMKDATFLLVCEEACRGKHVKLDWPDAHVRYVKSFNPDSCVTDASCGDQVGWQLIFDEFRPRVIKQQRHKFKFEG